MQNFLYDIIIFFVGDNAFLGTFLSSMLPIIEVRASITLGVNGNIFSSTLSPALSLFASILGSTFLTAILLCILIPFFRYLRKFEWCNNIYTRLENKVIKHRDKLNKKQHSLTKYFYLGTLCALPIPLTGYYTSALIAGMCGFKFLPSLIAIVLGNIVCALIMLAFIFLIPNVADFILYLFCIIFVIFVVYVLVTIILSLVKKKKL